MAPRNPNLAELISQLDNVTEDSNGWNARCPCHDDNTNSLTIAEDDGVIGICCQAGCETTSIVYACGMSMRSLFPDHGKRKDGKGKSSGGRIVEHYAYRDEQGVILFRVCRMEPKDFRQQRPDGEGGWSWTTKGVRRVPYRLPELLDAPKDAIVYICEGEKDVDRLRDLGLVATTNPGGASKGTRRLDGSIKFGRSKWLKEFNAHFYGRNIICLPDNDEPGKHHAELIRQNLEPVASAVGVVELPGLELKGDVFDWLSAGGTINELNRLAESALQQQPTADSVQDRAISCNTVQKPESNGMENEQVLCQKLGIEVLGYIEGISTKAKVYSINYHRTRTIDVDRLTYSGILQLCGPTAKEHVSPSAEAAADDPSLYSVKQVTSAIALLSGGCNAGEDSEWGAGCWRVTDDNGRKKDEILLVGAGEAALLNGKAELSSIRVPKYRDMLLDTRIEHPWFDLDQVNKRIVDYSTDWSADVVNRMEARFGDWRWKRPHEPLLISGLVIATWLQSLWSLRPQVAIVGTSKAGKSWFGNSIAAIFGSLGLKSSQASAAGVRQMIARSSRIMIVDEIDSTKGQEQKAILEMARAASSGDTILRGTGGAQAGLEFRLNHMFWVSGININMDRAPDRNRWVICDLLSPEKDKVGKLRPIGQDEAEELRVDTLAIALKVALPAVELAVKLKEEHQFEGVDSRQVECFAVPAAVLSIACGFNAEKILERFCLGSIEDRTEENVRDEIELLDEIMRCRVFVGGGKQRAVSQILNDDSQHVDRETHMEVLESCGVTTFGWGAEKTLFISPKAAREHLFHAKSRWNDQNIKQVLARIEGAVNVRRKLSGGRPRGIEIPWSVLVRECLIGDESESSGPSDAF